MCVHAQVRRRRRSRLPVLQATQDTAQGDGESVCVRQAAHGAEAGPGAADSGKVRLVMPPENAIMGGAKSATARREPPVAWPILLRGCDMNDSTTSPEGPNPSGLCMCGCGGVTSVFRKTCTAWVQFKGKHARYIFGHQGRKSPVEYIVNETTGCWEWALGRNGGGYG